MPYRVYKVNHGYSNQTCFHQYLVNGIYFSSKTSHGLWKKYKLSDIKVLQNLEKIFTKIGAGFFNRIGKHHVMNQALYQTPYFTLSLAKVKIINESVTDLLHIAFCYSPGKCYCTFLSDGSRFMLNNRIGHCNGRAHGSEHAVIFIHFNTSFVCNSFNHIVNSVNKSSTNASKILWLWCGSWKM